MQRWAAAVRMVTAAAHTVTARGVIECWPQGPGEAGADVKWCLNNSHGAGLNPPDAQVAVVLGWVLERMVSLSLYHRITNIFC